MPRVAVVPSYNTSCPSNDQNYPESSPWTLKCGFIEFSLDEVDQLIWLFGYEPQLIYTAGRGFEAGAQIDRLDGSKMVTDQNFVEVTLKNMNPSDLRDWTCQADIIWYRARATLDLSNLTDCEDGKIVM